MNTRLFFRFSFLRPIIVLALACLAGSLRAHDQASQHSFDEYIFTNKGIVIEDGVLIQSHHRSGVPATLGNVIDALRKIYLENADSFVLSPGLDKVKIADIKLVAGTPSMDLEAIQVASGDKFDWEQRDASGRLLRSSGTDANVFPMALDPATGLPSASATSDEHSLFVLRPPRAAPESERTVEVFNLAPYFDRTGSSNASGKRAEELHHELVDQLTAIIDQTIDAVRADNPVDGRHPKYSFHSGANLLVVVGARDDLNVARKVLKAVINPTSVETGANPFEPANVSDFTRRLKEIEGAYKASDVMKWGTAPGYISPAPPGRSASPGQPASSSAPAPEDPVTPEPATPR